MYYQIVAVHDDGNSSGLSEKQDDPHESYKHFLHWCRKWPVFARAIRVVRFFEKDFDGTEDDVILIERVRNMDDSDSLAVHRWLSHPEGTDCNGCEASVPLMRAHLWGRLGCLMPGDTITWMADVCTSYPSTPVECTGEVIAIHLDGYVEAVSKSQSGTTMVKSTWLWP